MVKDGNSDVLMEKKKMSGNTVGLAVSWNLKG